MPEGTDGAAQGVPQQTGLNGLNIESQVESGLTKMFNRLGQENAARELYQDNYKQRERTREAEAALDAYKALGSVDEIQAEREVAKNQTATYGALGAVDEIQAAFKTLESYRLFGDLEEMGATVELIKAYQQHGSPDEVQTILTDRDSARSALQAVQRQQVLRDVAQKANLEYKVLSSLDGLMPGLEYEIGDESVLVKNGDDKIALSDFIDKTWPEFKAALIVEPSGAPYVPQAPSGAGGEKSVLGDILARQAEQRAEATNPYLEHMNNE